MSCKRTKCRPASGRPVQTRTPAAPAQLPRTRCSGPAYGQPDPNGAAGPPSVSWTDCWCPETGSMKKKQIKGMKNINNCGWKFIKILVLKVKIVISHKFSYPETHTRVFLEFSLLYLNSLFYLPLCALVFYDSRMTWLPVMLQRFPPGINNSLVDKINFDCSSRTKCCKTSTTLFMFTSSYV